MDVRCNRCGTEYDFDDALISERGTTVKCTNCGLQFKVYPSHHDAAPERWVVRTQAGRELVFTSLRELQRGIADRKVGPGDLLTRGQKPPRPLSSIAELEPFFQSSYGTLAADRVPRTLHGVAPPAGGVPEIQIASTEGAPHVPAAIGPGPPAPAPPPPVVKRSSPPPPSAAALSVTLPQADSPVLVEAEPSLDSAQSAARLPAPALSAEDQAGHQRLDVARAAQASSPRLPLETVPRSSPGSSPRVLLEPTPRPPLSASRASFHSYDEFAAPPSQRELHARRARSRWIVGVVLLGIAGLVAVTAGRRYLVQGAVPSAQQPVPDSDTRVKDFLERGKRLTEDGDYEGAQEELVKASALAEKDPQVLAALARLSTLRADVSWLRLRLLDPASTELVSATHRELGRRVGRTRQAVDRAFAVAPEDPVVIRARIDAMRLSGESEKAREWVAPVSNNPSQPENAYVLAALDLSDAAPVWASVLDRLRTAAAGEREPARARAALIYALARSGNTEDARAELAKLETQARPHVLLEELRGFVSRASSAAAAGSAAPARAVDPTKLPQLDTSDSAEERDTGVTPRDFRQALTQAAAASRAGDLARAERLYRAALEDQPGNVEALSGLGDVARRRGDSARAAELYDQVLRQNPSYLPAMIASADQKWAAGDRAAALALYKRIVDQAGASSDYGARAQARLNEVQSSPESAPAQSAAPPSEPAAPHIDTTDLPGFQ
jgi:predicted Zn finger-like uncharacterized protein